MTDPAIARFLDEAREDAKVSGKVTGGTGPYKAATGRITAKAITSTKAAVTITYTT